MVDKSIDLEIVVDLFFHNDIENRPRETAQLL